MPDIFDLYQAYSVGAPIGNIVFGNVLIEFSDTNNSLLIDRGAYGCVYQSISNNKNVIKIRKEKPTMIRISDLQIPITNLSSIYSHLTNYGFISMLLNNRIESWNVLEKIEPYNFTVRSSVSNCDVLYTGAYRIKSSMVNEAIILAIISTEAEKAQVVMEFSEFNVFLQRSKKNLFFALTMPRAIPVRYSESNTYRRNNIYFNLHNISVDVFMVNMLFNLAVIHNLGIIHGDIRSTNIVFVKCNKPVFIRYGEYTFKLPKYGYRIVLIDFGISSRYRIKDSMTPVMFNDVAIDGIKNIVPNEYVPEYDIFMLMWLMLRIYMSTNENFVWDFANRCLGTNPKCLNDLYPLFQHQRPSLLEIKKYKCSAISLLESDLFTKFRYNEKIEITDKIVYLQYDPK
jgi:serine/threonine protein kinase